MPPRRKKESPSADIARSVNSATGSESIRLGSDPVFAVRLLPTGVLPLDVLLQGGLPTGRFTEIHGDYSSLKSLIAFRAMAAVQAAGGTCALADTEHTYDPEWFEEQGGYPDDLMLLGRSEDPNENYGERIIGAMQGLIMDGIDLIVWDSIAATQPKSVHERSPEETVQPGRIAAMMSEGLRRLNSVNRATAILCLNQTRVNIGITFGDPTSLPGGKALPFYASHRIKLAKAGKVTDTIKAWDGDEFVTSKIQVGQKMKATLLKSKLTRPFRETWFTYDMGGGRIDDVGFAISQGLEHGFVIKDNAMWSLPYWPKRVRGRDKFVESLTEEDIAWLTESMIQEGAADFPGGTRPAKKKA